jgi:hypothetical protein
VRYAYKVSIAVAILRAVLLAIAAVLALIVLSPPRANQQEWIFISALMTTVGVLVAVAVALPN